MTALGSYPVFLSKLCSTHRWLLNFQPCQWHSMARYGPRHLHIDLRGCLSLNDGPLPLTTSSFHTSSTGKPHDANHSIWIGLCWYFEPHFQVLVIVLHRSEARVFCGRSTAQVKETTDLKGSNGRSPGAVLDIPTDAQRNQWCWNTLGYLGISQVC